MYLLEKVATTPSGYEMQSIYCIIFGRQYLAFDILLVSSSFLWEDIYLSLQCTNVAERAPTLLVRSDETLEKNDGIMFLYQFYVSG